MMRSSIAVLAVLVCAFVFAAGCGDAMGASTDWPHWRGPNSDGISSESGWSTSWPQDGPKVLWKKTIGKGFSSIAVADGRAYTIGNINNTDHVWCFDAATGKELWKHTYRCKVGGHPGPRATPTVDGTSVYTLSREGHLFCFDAGTGKINWEKNVGRGLGITVPGWGFAGSPVVEGELLIINVGKAGLALNKKSGDVIWKTGSEKAGFSTPSIYESKGKRCIAVFAAKGAVGLSMSGKTLWEYPWKTKYDVNAVTPIVFDGKVFISSDYGTGCALLDISGSEPKEIWRNRRMKNHFNNCILWKGYLYGVDSSRLKCLDVKTGDEKWSWSNSGKGSLMLADGKLIVLSDKGVLSVAPATPEGFKPIASAKVLGGLCWTTPVLSGDRIYCRNREGDLVCLDVSGK